MTKHSGNDAGIPVMMTEYSVNDGLFWSSLPLLEYGSTNHNSISFQTINGYEIKASINWEKVFNHRSPAVHIRYIMTLQ